MPIPPIPLAKNTIKSKPPPGMCKVTNVYWDPKLGKIVCEFENEPIPSPEPP